MHDLLGVDPDEILLVSAKEGTGIDELLEAIVRRVPPPRGQSDAPLRALIFDSYYDRYRGAIPSVRVVDGVIAPGMHITFGANDAQYEVDEVGYLQLRQVKAPKLTAGRGRVRPGERAFGRRDARRRHDLRRRQPRQRAAARLQGSAFDGVRRHLSDRIRRNTKTCATRWRSCS